jgi:hypothetical protein
LNGSLARVCVLDAIVGVSGFRLRTKWECEEEEDGGNEHDNDDGDDDDDDDEGTFSLCVFSLLFSSLLFSIEVNHQLYILENDSLFYSSSRRLLIQRARLQCNDQH